MKYQTKCCQAKVEESKRGMRCSQCKLLVGLLDIVTIVEVDNADDRRDSNLAEVA